jgi:hydrogenase maturation protein HypF
MNVEKPIQKAGKLLSEGYLIAVKGNGGFHIASSAVLEKSLSKLRYAKHRRQKPFALMSPNLEAVNTFAEVNSKEKQLLTSLVRPIVLLRKNVDYYLSELVSPGLHNVGVMLPYTGLHYMLFNTVNDSAFVMTSANPPNQPIIIDNLKAKRELEKTVDYFLFHNRRILHRCDDSVCRAHSDKQVLIRRSRGYVPAPIFLGKKSKKCILSLGAELNNTVCLLLENKAFISQHIGDVENVETQEMLRKVSYHLISLTKGKVDTIACDLHPKFTTTHFAKELSKKHGWEIIQVQHHHAHAASLLEEHNIDESVVICCDGYGYGLEGDAWGGEILFCERDNYNFERLAHLQKQPLVGGDLATKYPLRMTAGILFNQKGLEAWLQEKKDFFPHKEKEINLVFHQLEKNIRLPKTTSCGRVLDAVSAILGVCYLRTYEGEPAMKLESLASYGKNILEIKPKIHRNVLDTTHMLMEIFQYRNIYDRADLALSAHEYIAKGLAELVIQKADEKGIKYVGFSGGVAYNKILSLNLKHLLESSGLRFISHEKVPPGDGGTSFGQACVASY